MRKGLLDSMLVSYKSCQEIKNFQLVYKVHPCRVSKTQNIILTLNIEVLCCAMAFLVSATNHNKAMVK